MNVIHSKPRNRLLHERIDKLEYVSINTRTRAAAEAKAEAKTEVEAEEERVEQEDRLLLRYELNNAVECMIEAERNKELELLTELDSHIS